MRWHWPGLIVVLALSGWPAAGASPSDSLAAMPGADGLHVSTYAADLETPWGMEFLPDGQLLVTERPGRLRIISADGQQMSPAVKGLPPVDRRQHGGLLDVTIDPDFESNRVVYLSYSEAGAGRDAGRNSLVVARARLNRSATRLRDFRVLFRQTPGAVSGEGLGGRLAVAPDGYLFVTIGDRFVASGRRRAQSLAFYQGKTVRIRTDGAIPAGNPFVNEPGARPEIWSLGHRNPQGALIHPETGELWVAEHGPSGGDEVNIVRKGRNYGWPIVTYGCEYETCDPIGEGTERPGMEPPLVYWEKQDSIAPSNLILYRGDQFPQWQGSLLVGALAGQAVWRIELAGDAVQPRVVARQPLFTELGERIRDLREGPDGALYLLTDAQRARIVRIARPQSAM